MVKTMLLGLAIIAAAPATFAAKPARACPAGTRLSMDCASTWQKGDEDIAASLLDSIMVCNKDEQVFLVVQKDDAVETGEAEVVRRAGGNSYTLKTKDVDFTLSHATGLATGRSRKARFSILVKGTGSVFSSTYTCRF